MDLHIILQNPPVNIHFALQKGHGNNFEAVGLQLSGGGDLHFVYYQVFLMEHNHLFSIFYQPGAPMEHEMGSSDRTIGR